MCKQWTISLDSELKLERRIAVQDTVAAKDQVCKYQKMRREYFNAFTDVLVTQPSGEDQHKDKRHYLNGPTMLTKIVSQDFAHAARTYNGATRKARLGADT
jgi:hypothetical protein